MLDFERSFCLKEGLNLSELVYFRVSLVEVNVGLLMSRKAFWAQYFKTAVFGAEKLILFTGVFSAVIMNLLLPTFSATTHLDLSTK